MVFATPLMPAIGLLIDNPCSEIAKPMTADNALRNLAAVAWLFFPFDFGELATNYLDIEICYSGSSQYSCVVLDRGAVVPLSGGLEFGSNFDELFKSALDCDSLLYFFAECSSVCGVDVLPASQSCNNYPGFILGLVE
jgi:hypothetical protein